MKKENIAKELGLFYYEFNKTSNQFTIINNGNSMKELAIILSYLDKKYINWRVTETMAIQLLD